MCGSATLTMEESMAPISVPKVIDAVTSHLLGLGRIARRLASATSGPTVAAEGGFIVWPSMPRRRARSLARVHATGLVAAGSLDGHAALFHGCNRRGVDRN